MLPFSGIRIDSVHSPMQIAQQRAERIQSVSFKNSRLVVTLVVTSN